MYNDHNESLTFCQEQQVKPFGLDSVLKEFTTEEKLQDSHCEKCKDGELVKKLAIWKLPQILIINFKRFEVISGISNKIYIDINFPFESFDAKLYMEGDSPDASSDKYELYAIVV